MLLKSIKYHNFRPFIGDQEVDLSIEDKMKNVVVILGDNTFGKSTFVLSFIWCLYGESRFNRPDDILNSKVEDSMPADGKTTEKASVEVVFEDDNKIYTMCRTQEFVKTAKGKLSSTKNEAVLTYVDESGETRKIGPYQSDINNAIRAILPVDLSSFFFFEGEKSNEITRKDLGTAVRTLLGLEAFDKMRSHLFGSQTQNSPYSNSVMGEYLQKQNDESGELAQEQYEKKLRAEYDLSKAEEQIIDIEKNIAFYENSIEDLNNKLRQAAPSRNIQIRRDTIKKELDIAEENLKKKNKAFLNLFSKESLPLFMHPLMPATYEKLNAMNASDKGIKGIEAKAIHELLHRGECLCGTDLKEGSLAYKNVEKYIEYVPPKSLGTLVSDMVETIEESNDKAKDFAEKFEEAYSEIMQLRTSIDSLEAEDKHLLSELKKIGNLDIGEAENDLIYYKEKIRNLSRERDELRDLCTNKKSEIDTAQNNFNMYKNKNEKTRKYQLYYRYAESIYQWVNENYSAKEDELRLRLNKNVTDLFNNMYSGKREIRIDDKYNIRMTVNNKTIDDTGGLRVIQYFAYVGGLVKLAYEVMENRKEENESESTNLGEQYPLVLDAAFSHADDKHTKNISKELSNAASQLIFALMPKDWQYAKNGLEGRVGRMYELRKIDEEEAQIVEV